MNMKKSKKRIISLCLALSLILSMAASFAYFTDRVQTSASFTAGTLELGMTADWATETNAVPGFKYDLGYSISNSGNKSADVRETIVLRSSLAFTSKDAAEFKIYKSTDVEQDASGAYVPKNGASTVGTATLTDSKTITYKLDEYVLNGTGANAETENGISSNKADFSYVIIFDKAADNDWLGATVTVDYLAEAKQHRNTDANTWATVATQEITFAGSQVDVVPEK